MEKEKFWYYVSTKATCDPVKTIFLCGPQQNVTTKEDAEQFAENSGWKKAVEDDASLLIVPFTNDWRKESKDLIPSIYNEYKNDFYAPSKKTIPGRDGVVWTWETLLYLVGYEEGADYAGDVLIAHPNYFAGTVLLDGSAHDFSTSDQYTDHWLVKNPSLESKKKNNEIPVALWLFSDKDQTETLNNFKTVDQAEIQEYRFVNGLPCTIYHNKKNIAEEVRVFNQYDKKYNYADLIMKYFFDHVIRWKNSPDGTLSYRSGKESFYSSKKYNHHKVTVNDLEYPYAIYLPQDLSKDDAKGLPLVFSIHGRGEPAWIFAEKNGWEELANETKAFIVALPDSKDNIWSIDRDKDTIKVMIEDIKEKYDIDLERVYITGFSNGAVYTCQQFSTYPELFAAASPWNGPSSLDLNKMSSQLGTYIYHPDFETSGYEIPVYYCTGDNDSKATCVRDEEIDYLLKINACTRDKETIIKYHENDGYESPDRLQSKAYCNKQGTTYLINTIMKDMPHGAIKDEARAAWNFMKRFKRPQGSKKVIEIMEGGK